MLVDKLGLLCTTAGRVQPLWKAAWRFLKELTKLPYDPAIPLLEYTQRDKTETQILTHLHS